MHLMGRWDGIFFRSNLFKRLLPFGVVRRMCYYEQRGI